MKPIITFIAFLVVSCGCLCVLSSLSSQQRSKNFEVNGMTCYWEISNLDFSIWSLKDDQTNNVLLEVHVDDLGFDTDAKINSIEKFNHENFVDLNFDQLKDFKCYSRGSMPMTSVTSIYLFNNLTKKFDAHDELSDTAIEEVDAEKRKLVTSSFTFDTNTKKIHRFSKSGKLRYSEIIRAEHIKNEDSAGLSWTIYEKIVDKKVIKRKRYLTKGNEE